MCSSTDQRWNQQIQGFDSVCCVEWCFVYYHAYLMGVQREEIFQMFWKQVSSHFLFPSLHLNNICNFHDDASWRNEKQFRSSLCFFFHLRKIFSLESFCMNRFPFTYFLRKCSIANWMLLSTFYLFFLTWNIHFCLHHQASAHERIATKHFLHFNQYQYNL